MADLQINPHLSPTNLKAWLASHQIDTSQWGEGNAKSVADLWAELQRGECSFEEDPPLRRVEVVEVIVRHAGRELIEREQHFLDGRIRVRNQPPSEKMHPSETPIEAARRCLIEELALSADAISIPPQEIAARFLREESGSYPNLISEYCLYAVVATVDSLPTSDFIIPNAAHDDGDPVVAHRWAWVDSH